MIDVIENRKPFAPVFGNVYENEGGGEYRCIDPVPLDHRSDPCDALMQSTTVTTWGAWTFMAKGVHIYPNGKIDWDYSTGGAFEKSVFATLADCFDPLGNVLPL